MHERFLIQIPAFVLAHLYLWDFIMPSAGTFLRKAAQKLRKVDAYGQTIFQQDSAPCRVLKVMIKYFKDKMILCLRNRLDLNHIQNLWSIVKARLGILGWIDFKDNCSKKIEQNKTKTKLIEAVMQICFWDKKPVTKLVDYVKSVKNVIKGKKYFQLKKLNFNTIFFLSPGTQ